MVTFAPAPMTNDGIVAVVSPGSASVTAPVPAIVILDISVGSVTVASPFTVMVMAAFNAESGTSTEPAVSGVFPAAQVTLPSSVMVTYQLSRVTVKM